MNSKSSQKRILGITFFVDGIEKLLSRLQNQGGLLVAPAAPNLAYMDKDLDYAQSIRCADYVITDSGYLLLLWKILRKEKLPRLSGLGFLKSLFKDESFLNSTRFWIMPSQEASLHNQNWLNAVQIQTNETDCYVSPHYDRSKAIIDPDLLKILQEKKPDYILINIGGGIQEKLGYWLIEQLDYKPAILCTGAAIAFLSGLQAKIPTWADRYCLGWLFRCLQDPKGFIPRYIKAFRLLILLLRDKPSNAE